jgi:hypothetical protein
VLGDAVTQPGRVVDVSFHAAGGRVQLGPEPGRGDHLEDGIDASIGRRTTKW